MQYAMVTDEHDTFAMDYCVVMPPSFPGSLGHFQQLNQDCIAIV
jgi:hypothetical protein